MAPLGRKGCDPPYALLDVMIKFILKEGPFDILLLPGDFVAHGIPEDPYYPFSGNYTLLK